MGKRGKTAANHQFQTGFVHDRSRSFSFDSPDFLHRHHRRGQGNVVSRCSFLGNKGKMYPCIANTSRVDTSYNRSSPCYIVPSTKLKNVVCIFCKSKFYVPGNSVCSWLLLWRRDVALSIRIPAFRRFCWRCNCVFKICPNVLSPMCKSRERCRYSRKSNKHFFLLFT